MFHTAEACDSPYNVKAAGGVDIAAEGTTMDALLVDDDDEDENWGWNCCR